MLATFTQVVARNPGTTWEAKARAEIGLHLKFDGEWDLALQEFDRVLALPISPRMKHNIKTSVACILLTRGQFDEAERHLTEVQQETTDWDQKKYVRSFIKAARRRRSAQQQSRLDSCGAKSLAFVLKNQGRSLTEDELAAAFSPHERALRISLGTLREAARRLGIEVTAGKLSVDALAATQLPVIALVKPEHFVVIRAMADGFAEIHDPDRGDVRMTHEALKRMWSGWVLLFGDYPRSSFEIAGAADLADRMGGICACCPTGGTGDRPGEEEIPPVDKNDTCPGMPHIWFNSVNLNVMVRDVDLRYAPPIGPQVEFQRWYNGDAITEGDFGPGWTHSYNVFLQEYPTEVQVSRGSGRVDRYLDTGGGAFAPPIGVNDELVRTGPSTFTLNIWADKVTYSFSDPEGDASYRLDAITDRNANAVTLHYLENIPTVIGGGIGSAPPAGYLLNPQGVDADPTGNVYVADSGYHRLQVFSGSGAALAFTGMYGSGPGEFNTPVGLAVDAMNGVLYVADSGNNRVQKYLVYASGLTYLGSVGEGTLSNPRDVAVDEEGNLYVVDLVKRVVKYDASGTLVTSWQFGVWPDSFEGIGARGGVVYVANTGSDKIWKFDYAGNWVGGWGIYGSGPGQLYHPTEVDIDASGNVYVADRGNNRVQKFDPSGVLLAMWGTQGTGQGSFVNPGYLALDASSGPEHVLVADTENNRLQRFDLAGAHLASFGQGGQPGGTFEEPQDIALDGSGNWYVTDASLNRVQKFDPNGGYLSAWGSTGAGEGQLTYPHGIVYDPVHDRVLVADSSNNRVQAFSTEGVFQFSFTTTMPYGLALRSDEGQVSLYVTSRTQNTVRRYLLSAGGATLMNQWGEYGPGDGQFMNPAWATVDSSGNVYISDAQRVQKFTADGVFVQTLLTGYEPIARWAGGYLYELSADSVVVRWSAGMTALASWGTRGSLPGEFTQPRGMAVDSSGDLIVVDGANDRLQRFSGGYRLGPFLARIEDAAGGRNLLGYRYENANIQSITDPLGHVANFDYTERALTASTDMAGITSEYGYTGYYDLDRLTVPAGDHLLTYGHDGATFIEYQTPRPGEHYRHGEEGFTHTYTTNALGQESKYYWGTWEMTSRVMDPLNGQTLYAYDAHGNRTGFTDAAGQTRSWTLDARGRLTTLTDEMNRTTSWTFDDQNHTVTRTDPAPFNYQTRWVYDERENLLSITDPENRTVTMTYYPDGRLHTVTNPLGKTTTYTYNGLVTTIVDPAGKTLELTYDSIGRLVSRKDALNYVTEYGYNELGRRLWERHPDGTQRAWAYSCCGLAAEIDELWLDGLGGRRTDYQRDQLNRLTAVINRPDSRDPALDRTLVSYAYDEAGRKTLQSDGLGRGTSYQHDAAGRPTRTTYPDTSFEERTWFADGALHTRTDRRGNVTTYEYDDAGRLIGTTYQDGSSSTAGYDELGRMTSNSTKDPGGAVLTSQAVTYTPSGRVETTTHNLFGITKIFRYQYDAGGRLAWWRDESVTPFKTTTYAYYDNGWLWTITDPEGKVFTYEYYDDGSLRKKSYGNGMFAEYEYSNRGWLTALRHRKSAQPSGVMAQFIYKDGQGIPWYDAVGNRTAVDLTGSEHHTYGYDAANLDRLLTVDRPQTSNDESYTYDQAGNRLTSRQYADWAYDPQDDELQSWDSVSYTHDAAGNRATKTEPAGTTTYTYDYESRLVRVDLPGGSWVSYDYDSLGRRVRKNSNGTVTLYWYDGEDIVVESSAAGVEQARYTHGPGIDSPLKVRLGSNSYYYHEDALGSIVLMTSASRNSSKTYKYDAFGNVYSQTGSVANSYQYTGREWDSESALYYYRARHYDPKVGRFLQVDKIPPRPEEMNAYAYVGNNPLLVGDPYGLAPKKKQCNANDPLERAAIETRLRRVRQRLSTGNFEGGEKWGDTWCGPLGCDFKVNQHIESNCIYNCVWEHENQHKKDCEQLPRWRRYSSGVWEDRGWKAEEACLESMLR